MNYQAELKIIDSSQNQLFVVGQRAEKKYKQKPIFLVDLNKGKILWQIMSLSPGFRVNFDSELQDQIIFEANKTVFSIDRQSGQTQWTRKGDYCPLDLENHLAYTKIDSGFLNQMELFDTRTGKTLWNRGKFKMGWWNLENQIFDKTIWLSSGDGLHTFNLKEGTGWDIKVPTNATGGIGKVVALAVLSAIAGGYSSASTDRYDDLTSNALIVDDQIYYAGNRILIRVDLNNGTEKWRIKVPKIAAHSVLFEEDDHILMFGLGWCYKNYRISDYSIPWVGRFNKVDGKQTLYKPLGAKTRLLDYSNEDDGYYLLTKDKLYFVDRKRPQDIFLETQNDPETKSKFGTYRLIIDKPENFFVQSETDSNQFKALTDFKTDLTFGWIKTNKGIVQYDRELLPEHWFSGKHLQNYVAGKANLRLIRGWQKKSKSAEDETYLPPIKLIDLSDNGSVKAEIITDAEFTVLKNQLLLWGPDYFIVQPLTPLYEIFKQDLAN